MDLNWTCKWARQYRNLSRRSRRRTPARRHPLRLELLEDRVTPSAVLFTDQPSYVAGQTAVIVAKGFSPNETVTLRAVQTDGSAAALNPSQWAVSADETGAFQTSADLLAGQSAGGTIDLSATGQQGNSATTSFGEDAPVTSARITTDRSDYQPGATALITGSGFLPNETVTLQVLHSDTTQPGVGVNPWSVTAGADGSFNTTWFVNPADSLGASFIVNAGGSDGDSANATFTDSTELIVNGGFEAGDFSGWQQGGNTGFTSVTTGSAHSGAFAAALGPVGSDGLLQQSFSTAPGAFYTISWWMASDGVTPNDFNVFFDGQPLFLQSNIPSHGYQQFSVTTAALLPVSTLQFGFRDDPGFLHLDDISVQAAFPTTTTVFGSPNPSVFGQPVTFIANVSSPGVVPTGTVQFQIDGSNFGGPVNVSGGTAVGPTISSLTAGGHSVAAIFTSPSFESSAGFTTQSVFKATPIVNWGNPADITYGTTLDGGQLNATASVPGTFAYGPGNGTVLNAGDNQVLNVTFFPNDTTDYNVAFRSVLINVAKAVPTINWASPDDITYGSALGATQLNATSSWTVGGILSGVAGTFTYTPAGGTILSAGDGQTLSVYFSPSDTTDYTANSKSVLINVTPIAASVTPNAAGKVYGDPDPALSGMLDGFLAGDGVSATYRRTAGETVLGGPYTISATLSPTAVLGNYAITYNTAAFAITPRPVAVTADAQTKTYGDPDPVLTFQITGGSLAFDDAFTGSLSREAGEHVGGYAIGQGTLALGDNYDLTYQGASLGITSATLTVTADATTKTYGQADPALTYQATGFQFSDTAASVLSGALTRAAGETIAGGPYAIGQGTLAANSNYVISFTGNQLTITSVGTATAETASDLTPLFGVDTVTFTAGVSVVAPGSGSPTGSIDFFDVTTNADLGLVALSGGTASLTTGSLGAGAHVVEARYSGDGNFAPSTGSAGLDVIAPSRIQGLVWQDFNDDGEVDFGERAIGGVVVHLTGFDDRGNAVNRSMTTDGQGVYEFVNLRPSSTGGYTLTEEQPAGFLDGVEHLGTVNGVLSGVAVDNAFSHIVLAQPGADGVNYNFGERPPAGSAVTGGQTATIGFWQNKNGHNLIKSLNGGPGSTQLANWLAATLPNMYGAQAGPNNLTGKTNDQVAAFYNTLFKRTAAADGPPKLDAQVLATALAVYVTNHALAGNAAAAYGFQVTAQGVGVATFNVGTSGAAFGVANTTTMTVLDLLLATDAQAANGVLYGGNAARRTFANNVYSAVNRGGEI